MSFYQFFYNIVYSVSVLFHFTPPYFSFLNDEVYYKINYAYSLMYTNFQLNFQAFSKKVNNLSSRYLHHLLYEMYVPDPSNRVLEDDIISFYGTSTGLYSYTTVLGAQLTIPSVLAVYIDIN